jgi:large subunit ribosomal protein L2
MPYGIKIGDTVESGWAPPIKTGNSLPLLNIPLNIKIHAIESFPGSGAVYTRAAGN